ncbi:MAG: NUDIX hydrolase [Candidatus Ornithospirochaeta sp.]
MDGKSHIWRDGEKKRLLSTPIFTVDSVERTSPDGKKGTFITMENPDWVSVIPLVWREDEGYVFVMVDQYRHGSGRVTREFPAGLTDECEDALAAASRELEEETGMQGNLVEIASFNPNPAFMTNRQTFFLGTDLRKVSGQHLDEMEDVEVKFVKVDEVVENMGSGLYDNGIMMAAIGAFLRYRDKHPEIMERKK